MTVSGVTVNSKTYDSTTRATFTGSYTLNGTVYTGDTVSLNEGTATATFSSKDVATGKTVSISGLALTVATAADYSLTNSSSTTTASISPFGLTASNVTANNKTYDGTMSEP